MNSNWIADLNVRPETIQFLQANGGGNPLHIGLKEFFFKGRGYDSKVKRNTSKNKQMGLHEIKQLTHSEGRIHETKR